MEKKEAGCGDFELNPSSALGLGIVREARTQVKPVAPISDGDLLRRSSTDPGSTGRNKSGRLSKSGRPKTERRRRKVTSGRLMV